MNLGVWLTLVALLAGAKDCWAWGATGHEWVSGIAIEKLPDSVPAFVRTPEAAAEIAVLGRGQHGHGLRPAHRDRQQLGDEGRGAAVVPGRHPAGRSGGSGPLEHDRERSRADPDA